MSSLGLIEPARWRRSPKQAVQRESDRIFARASAMLSAVGCIRSSFVVTLH